MEKEKTRLSRLTAILTQMQSKRLITARDLANKHGVSVRTIYRDIKTLERSGIPIVTEEGKGFTLLDGFLLSPVMFTEGEANALITAEQLINRNKDNSLVEQYQNAITKIRAVMKSNQQEKVDLLSERIQIRQNLASEMTSKYLIQLQSAITNFQVVKLDYLSLKNYRSQRLIEPFALFSTKENWILVAYCQQKEDFRAFRLDCIQSITLTSDIFEPHQMTLQEYFERCKQKFLQTYDIPLTHAGSILPKNQKQFDMEKVIIEPFRVIGISVDTINEGGQSATDIGNLWNRFLSEQMLNKIPNKVDDTIYSIYTNYQGDHTQRYTTLLGCKVHSFDEIPEGLQGHSFGGGSYVLLESKGDITQGMVYTQWQKIWDMEIDRSFKADFEIYGPEAQNPKDAKVMFYVGVK